MTDSLYLLAPADRLMIKKDIVLKHPLFLSAIVTTVQPKIRISFIHDMVSYLFLILRKLEYNCTYKLRCLDSCGPFKTIYEFAWHKEVCIKI